MDLNRIRGNASANYPLKNESKKSTSTERSSDTTLNHESTSSQMLDTFERSTEQDFSNLTYKPMKKKLTSDEVQSIKDQQQQQQHEMIQQFIQNMLQIQSHLLGKSEEQPLDDAQLATNDLLKDIFGSLEQAYPPIATDPVGAKKAIEEGGPYSAGAVADRIMKMATYFAGEDPEKLKEMRNAVEDGFAEAESMFKEATTLGLPQLSQDTMAEVRKRFDELEQKLGHDFESNDLNR